MSTTNQNEYPLAPNSYAAFDAISLRNLVIQRLNDQKLFTDQNYIGSNLASVIDIVSFTYNTLLYYLNKTSTESTFTEAQLYENINRIVKLLDYKPVGYQTSTLSFQASANSTFSAGSYTIPRYSYLTIGGVSFSFNEDISFKIPTTGVVTPLTDLTNTKLLYQGVYGENPLYIAGGDVSEVVPITINSGTIDHFNIDVYVNEMSTGLWYEYTNVPNLYTENAFARSFEKRLNQNGVYEITFGDGINGRKLATGDQVAIYALQSSGIAGVVGPNVLKANNPVPVVYSTPTFNTLWPQVTRYESYTNTVNSSNLANISFDNVAGSTFPVDAENTESIRIHAPSNFKSQYRLVTQQDYQTFISTNFANFISDVKVFNNWDYSGKYLKYFNDIQVSPTEFKQILLNQVLYSDACNFNNVYVCVKPKASQGSTLKYLLPAQKETIISNVNPLKTISTEVTFVDPIYKAVSFGVPSKNGTVASEATFAQLEVVRNNISRRSDGSIISDVSTIISSFFNPTTTTIGGVFDYASLLSSVLAVDGVAKIRTTRNDTTDVYQGLSLFMWNPSFPNLDIQQVTSSPTMSEFEVFYFNNLANIKSKIVIVTS